MEIPVVTFLGYIKYKYFLKTTVELKPRQRVPCVGAGWRWASGLGAGRGGRGRRAAFPPVPLCVAALAGGVLVDTGLLRWPGKLLFLKHGSQKSTPQPLPDWEALILPGGAQGSPRAPSVSLSVCLCVGCVSCPWARSCSWLPPAVATAVCTCAWNPVLTSGVGRGGQGG